jgi:heme/copper-type cytochrome/quinol oxidase subunit 3
MTVATYEDISTYDVLPPELPAPEPDRPRLILIGTALACSAVIVGFAGLIGAYLAQRGAVIAAGGQWLPDEVTIPLTQPNFMAVTMVMAALAMTWAVYAAFNDDRANALIAVGLTLLFGLSYITQTLFLFSIMDLPIAERGMTGWMLWAVGGSHMALIAAGMVYAAAMGLRTLGGHITPRDREGLMGATLFWYVAVGVYLVIWYAVYITK